MPELQPGKTQASDTFATQSASANASPISNTAGSTTTRHPRHVPTGVYKLMLVTAALIWGGSFVVMKSTMDVFQPSWLIGVRFVITAALLAVVFNRQLRANANAQTVKHGCVLGVLIFGAYWFQTVGLTDTTPGKNAFLTDTYCVLVPFMFWLVTRRHPTKFNIIAAIFCITGVGFVSLSNDTFSIRFGDFMTLIGGVLYGAHIVATAIFSKKSNVLALTVYQFAVSGVLGILTGALTETPPDLSAITLQYVFNMIYLVVLASCVAMVFQNAALAHVSPGQASILLSLESVFGVTFSVIFYNEALTPPLVCGFVLIFVAIVLSEAAPKRPNSKKGL
jgi:drug/metabolite transporter (DMT)-like permease